MQLRVGGGARGGERAGRRDRGCRSSEPGGSWDGSVVGPGSAPGRTGVDFGARALVRAEEVMREAMVRKASFRKSEVLKGLAPGAHRAARHRPALPPGTRRLTYPGLLRSAPSGTDKDDILPLVRAHARAGRSARLCRVFVSWVFACSGLIFGTCLAQPSLKVGRFEPVVSWYSPP